MTVAEQKRYRLKQGQKDDGPKYIVVVIKSRNVMPDGKLTYKVEEQDPPFNTRPRSFDVFPVQLEEIHPDITNSEVMHKVRIQINQVNAEELKEKLSGLGIRNARTICKNRPKNGYLNLEQLVSLNPRLRVDWQMIGGEVSFEKGALVEVSS